jgi:hypothetical protein
MAVQRSEVADRISLQNAEPAQAVIAIGEPHDPRICPPLRGFRQVCVAEVQHVL